MKKLKHLKKSKKISYLINYRLILIIAIIIAIIILTNFFYTLNKSYNFKFNKAVFNKERDDYFIENSNIREILLNHPIEAFKNCKTWNDPIGYKAQLNNSKIFSCSILKYKDIIYIIEIGKKGD